MSSTELTTESAQMPITGPPASLHAVADSPLTAMRPQRSLWSNAWRRLRKNVMAMAALCFLFFLLIVAIFAPVIAPHNPVKTDVAVAGTLRQAAWVNHPNPRKDGTWEYPLGTDSVGRDVFSRLVYGTRVSLVVGFIPMAVIILIGVPVGLIAGFAGGRIDNLLMRLTDVVYAFPALLLAIIMQISFGDTGVRQAAEWACPAVHQLVDRELDRCGAIGSWRNAVSQGEGICGGRSDIRSGQVPPDHAAHPAELRSARSSSPARSSCRARSSAKRC